MQSIDPRLSYDPPVPLMGSRAINAGNPNVDVGSGGLSEFDVRQAPYSRIVDGRIDMGAYEVQTANGALSGDFNGDGRVDGADFLAWQRGVGGTGNQQTGDATGNGMVDGSDLAVWRRRFVPAPFGASAAVVALPGESRAAAVDEALLAKADSERGAMFEPLRRPAYRPWAGEGDRFVDEELEPAAKEGDRGGGIDSSIEAIDGATSALAGCQWHPAPGVLKNGGVGPVVLDRGLLIFSSLNEHSGWRSRRYWRFASEKWRASTHFSTGRMPVAPGTRHWQDASGTRPVAPGGVGPGH